MKETMIVKRSKKEDEDGKGKTVNLRSGEMSKPNETDMMMDEKVQKLLKRDILMNTIFLKVKDKLRNELK